jgi:hypothetical protein
MSRRRGVLFLILRNCTVYTKYFTKILLNKSAVKISWGIKLEKIVSETLRN